MTQLEQKYEELIKEYASMDFGCMCKDCKKSRKKLLVLHSEISALKSQESEEPKLSHCPECGYATANGHVRGCQYEPNEEGRGAEEIKKAINHIIVNYWNDETKATELIFQYFASLPTKSVTDEEINAFYPINAFENNEYRSMQIARREGAKAHRDGLIPKK